MGGRTSHQVGRFRGQGGVAAGCLLTDGPHCRASEQSLGHPGGPSGIEGTPGARGVGWGWQGGKVGRITVPESREVATSPLRVHHRSWGHVCLLVWARGEHLVRRSGRRWTHGCCSWSSGSLGRIPAWGQTQEQHPHIRLLHGGARQGSTAQPQPQDPKQPAACTTAHGDLQRGAGLAPPGSGFQGCRMATPKAPPGTTLSLSLPLLHPARGKNLASLAGSLSFCLTVSAPSFFSATSHQFGWTSGTFSSDWGGTFSRGTGLTVADVPGGHLSLMGVSYQINTTLGSPPAKSFLSSLPWDPERRRGWEEAGLGGIPGDWGVGRVGPVGRDWRHLISLTCGCETVCIFNPTNAKKTKKRKLRRPLGDSLCQDWCGPKTRLSAHATHIHAFIHPSHTCHTGAVHSHFRSSHRSQGPSG